MKKIENSFAVTGFIGKDAEIRSFETAKRGTLFYRSQPCRQGR